MWHQKTLFFDTFSLNFPHFCQKCYVPVVPPSRATWGLRTSSFFSYVHTVFVTPQLKNSSVFGTNLWQFLALFSWFGNYWWTGHRHSPATIDANIRPAAPTSRDISNHTTYFKNTAKTSVFHQKRQISVIFLISSPEFHLICDMARFLPCPRQPRQLVLQGECRSDVLCTNAVKNLPKKAKKHWKL